MFDVAKIAKKIRETRIEKNMTQGDLADLMGVSYQAVSNWERGNSMPDISKLEDLCGFLGLSVGELLGIENKATVSVEKAIENKEELSFDEIADVAPIMPPKVLKEKTENAKKHLANFTLSSLSEIAEFLDSDYLSEVVHEALSSAAGAIKNLDGLFDTIEFLPDETIREIVEKAEEGDLDSVAECIEDLDDESADIFAEKCLEAGRFDLIAQCAEFLSDKALKKIAKNYSANGKFPELFSIAEYIPDEIYSEIIKNAKGKDISALFGFAEFFDDDAADAFAEKCLETDNTAIIIESAEYFSEKTFDKIIDCWLEKGKFDELTEICEYLERHQVKRIAKVFFEKDELDRISDIAEYM